MLVKCSREHVQHIRLKYTPMGLSGRHARGYSQKTQSILQVVPVRMSNVYFHRKRTTWQRTTKHWHSTTKQEHKDFLSQPGQPCFWAGLGYTSTAFHVCCQWYSFTGRSSRWVWCCWRHLWARVRSLTTQYTRITRFEPRLSYFEEKRSGPPNSSFQE